MNDILKQLALDPNASEVLQRFLILLHNQRLQTQAQLAKESEKIDAAEFAQKVMMTLLGACPMDSLPLLQQVSPAGIMSICDHNGLTLLHHACRLGLPAIVQKCLEINKHLCDVVTKWDGKPQHWTPLMVLVDKWQDTRNFQQCMLALLQACSPATYSMRAPTGQTPFHIAASRGNWWVMKRLCWGLYHAAGADDQAYAMVVNILNSPGGGRNAGVVDHAFRSHTSIALWLQDYWGGRPLLAKPSVRDYAYAYRR